MVYIQYIFCLDKGSYALEKNIHIAIPPSTYSFYNVCSRNVNYINLVDNVQIFCILKEFLSICPTNY